MTSIEQMRFILQDFCGVEPRRAEKPSPGKAAVEVEQGRPSAAMPNYPYQCGPEPHNAGASTGAGNRLRHVADAHAPAGTASCGVQLHSAETQTGPGAGCRDVACNDASKSAPTFPVGAFTYAKSLDPTWWNAAPGELRSDRYMEDRAIENDAEDTICSNCGHAWSFHVNSMLQPIRCDYESGAVDHYASDGVRQCKCTRFEDSGMAA